MNADNRRQGFFLKFIQKDNYKKELQLNGGIVKMDSLFSPVSQGETLKHIDV